MNVDSMIKIILDHEGGYVDHKNDKGGATNYGVTAKVYADFLGIDSNYSDLKTLIKAMPKDTAKMIYKELYYYQPKIDLLPELLQPQVFDMAVNHGANRAYKLLQTAINELTGSELVIDGYFGKLSWSALDKTLSHPIDLNNNLVYTRIDFYNSIVERDNTQKVFLNGWLKRANSFLIKSTY